jgi:hypothetical protein
VSYRILAHLVVEARDDREAAAVAKKIEGLLKTAMFRMAVAGEGVQLAGGDGRPVVYQPQREVA